MTNTPPSASFDAYHRLAVIGAAGKMGSGIAFLLLRYLACQKLTQPSENYTLHLIDANSGSLDGLKVYLHTQLKKWAEKNIILLRELAKNNPKLVSNSEIIEKYLTSAMEITFFGSSIDEAKDGELIFEAIIEDIDEKTALYTHLQRICSADTYFLSNTSSIPIALLDKKAHLQGRLIGFHLYNPPAVQKLIEIIPSDNGDPILKKLANQIALKLDKKPIFSKDKAGFIGNGHFLRDIQYGFTLVNQLKAEHGLTQSIYMINRVTQEFLLRPMGIFQLIDYVGLDVVDNVGKIMNQYLDEDVYDASRLQAILASGYRGGQLADGSQKPGFFRYQENKIEAILDVEQNKYLPLDNIAWKKSCDNWLGSYPEGYSWKSLSKMRDGEEKAFEYLTLLRAHHSPGVLLALDYLQHSQETSQQLAKEGIAVDIKDVDTVLKLGFYHIYGTETTH